MGSDFDLFSGLNLKSIKKMERSVMKARLKVWWPVQATDEAEIIVDIPDGQDVNDWIADNEGRIVDEVSGEDFDPKVFDLGLAGIKVIGERGE